MKNDTYTHSEIRTKERSKRERECDGKRIQCINKSHYLFVSRWKYMAKKHWTIRRRKKTRHATNCKRTRTYVNCRWKEARAPITLSKTNSMSFLCVALFVLHIYRDCTCTYVCCMLFVVVFSFWSSKCLSACRFGRCFILKRKLFFFLIINKNQFFSIRISHVAEFDLKIVLHTHFCYHCLKKFKIRYTDFRKLFP